ncbi:MAG: hypothetical protein HQL63_10375, partial [Magnetococcales bacterium]|nr:hypothetical protein [Magnetococcales bacterium]
MVKIKAELQDEARFLEGVPEKVAQGLTGPVKAGLDELSRVFARFKSEFATFDPEIKAKFDATSATGALDGLIARSQEFQTALQAGSTVTVNADTAQAVAAMEDVIARANALDGRVITYYVQQVTQEAHAMGGTVGLARGGRLPGFGGGDRIHALLEAGEFVIRQGGGAALRAGAAGIPQPHAPAAPGNPPLRCGRTGPQLGDSRHAAHARLCCRRSRPAGG